MTDNFRQEHKFLIGMQDRDILRYRLNAALRRDPHTDADGGYHIRSIYFDDTDHTAFREKLDGIKDRSKLRIRFYNFDDRYIVLEKKERNGELCRKTSQVIDRDTAQRMIDGKPSGGGAPLLDEYDALRNAGLRATIIVDYKRYAFMYPASNTRVTLDSNLATPIYSLDFFNPELVTYPVFEDNEALVEYKFDSFAPGVVTALLAGVPNVKTAVSKYARCLAMMDE